MTRFARFSVLGALATMLTTLPVAASAQGLIGIGPRISFIRGDVTDATPSQRLLGALLRIKASPHVALEGTIDYRSQTSTDMTQRVTDVPLQGTLLLYPIRSTISPYLLAGIGSYSEKTDVLGPNQVVTSTSTTRRTGWHAGFGGELAFGKAKHVAAFADYRYRFVTLGDGGTAVIPGVNALKIAHEGSMWTAGMVFYF